MKVVCATPIGQERDRIVASVTAYRYRASPIAGREGKEVVIAAAVDGHITGAVESDVEDSAGGGAIENGQIGQIQTQLSQPPLSDSDYRQH